MGGWFSGVSHVKLWLLKTVNKQSEVTEILDESGVTPPTLQHREDTSTVYR